MQRTVDPITKGLVLFSIALLCLLPFLAVPLGYIYGESRGLGWAANMAIFPAVLFLLTTRRTTSLLGGRHERMFLLFPLLFLGFAIATSTQGYGNSIIVTAGLLSIAGTFSAGIAAYALAKGGYSILPFLMKVILIGAIPLLAVPVLVAMDPQAFPVEQWTWKAYGFTNIRTYGDYPTVAIAAAATLSAAIFARGNPGSAENRKALAGLFAVLVVLWSLLAWSGTRAGIVALAVALPLGWVILRRLRVAEILFHAAAFGGGVALSALYTIPSPVYGLISRMSATTAVATSGADAANVLDGVSSGRVQLWAWAIEKIQDKPLAGWGYLPMQGMEQDIRARLAHTHNIVLEYGLSFGIPATIIVFAIMTWLWLRMGRDARGGDAMDGGAVQMVTMLAVFGMLAVTLMSPYQLLLFGLCMGAVLGNGTHRRILEDAAALAAPDAEDARARDRLFL